MFLVSILLIYTVPTIYAYFRLKKFFPRPLPKIVFTLFYLFVAFGFFIGEILSHRTSGGGWLKYIILVGFYTLPFLLYLLLAVFLLDILRGANRLLKIVPVEAIRNRKFQSTTIWMLFVIPIIIVFMGAIHAKTIRVNRYEVDIPRKSAVINHLKIALASDFHLGQITDKRFLEEFTGVLQTLNPDIILLPGDIIEGRRDDEKTTAFARQFRLIKSKYGLYGALGNHDSHNRDENLKFFADAGIKVLADEIIPIANSFYLVGRNDARSDNRKPIDVLLRQTANDLPVIVLDHRPTDIEAASQSGVDIQLSGHTHNGQLFPLNFIVGEMYGLAWKYRKVRNTHLFVTSGIFVWGPPVRTAGDSEIMIIDVNFEDN
ncbi:MAG TPA: metallophosphoesterase [Candidatus Deferrimicrobium sp.]|nr:metallophosphoesterase [Candidatus Deferrimicrobium sp.]